MHKSLREILDLSRRSVGESLLGVALCLIFASASFGQGAYVQVPPSTSTINGVVKTIQTTITICAANTAGTPCAPALANAVFHDNLLTQPFTNPLTTDANGNAPTFALASGNYTLTVTAAGFTGVSTQISVACAGGTCTAGTLTVASLTVSGTLNSNSLSSGNVANECATADGCQFVSSSGNDANTGHSLGKAKATFAAAYSALPTCTPNPINNGTGSLVTFTAPCGTIYLGAHATSATDGYLISSTVTINSSMVRIVGIDKLGTQIQCQTVSPCIQFSMGNSVGAGHAGGTVTAGPSPTMSTHGGLENLTIIGSSTANQIGVNCLDCTGVVFKDLLIEGFTGTSAVGLEMQNDLDGITERSHMDNVALDNNTTDLLITASSASLLSFNHSDWRNLQFSLGPSQTAITVAGFAQWSGYIDGVVNSKSGSPTATRLSILNSATFRGYDGTINDFTGTLTDVLGSTSSNFSTWGHQVANNGAATLQNSLWFVNNPFSGSNSGFAFQNLGTTGDILAPDGAGCGQFWAPGFTRTLFQVGCPAGGTAGSWIVAGGSSGNSTFLVQNGASPSYTFPNATGTVGLSQTVALTADWTCGTGGTVSSCVAATIIGSGGGVPLTFTLPVATQSYTLTCDGVVGQATAATANQWNLLTATNGATNVTANYSMATAATASAYGAVTDQASTTTTFQISPSWTLGGTGTKMPFHIYARIEGASASGTVVSLQLVAPTVADLVTIYRGASCSLQQ